MLWWITSLPCLSVCVPCITIDHADWRLGVVREIKVECQWQKQPERFICSAGVVEAAPRPALPRSLRRSQPGYFCGGSPAVRVGRTRRIIPGKKAASVHLRSWPRHKYLPLFPVAGGGEGRLFRRLARGEGEAVRRAGTARPVRRLPWRASSLR